MDKVRRKPCVLVILVAICLAVSCFITGGATAIADQAVEETGPHWTTVEFGGPIGVKEMNIKWDWNDLLQDATQADANANLAVAGLVMSQQAELSTITGLKVQDVLLSLGFSDLKSEYYKLSESENDVSNPARTFGHKAITKDGKQYHIVCAVFKGTTTLDDAVTDIKSVKDGFKKAGENCEESLEVYVRSIEGATKDNTILFITGHSLGAATANEVGLMSDSLANDSSKFVYAFASPNYATDVAEKKDAYTNFHTYTNEADLVPKVPLTIAPTYFKKVGVEHKYAFNSLDSTQKKKFERVYQYLKGKTYEQDTETHTDLKNHLCETYMAFVMSDFSDKDIDLAIATSRENPITVTGKTASVNPGKTVTLKQSEVLGVENAKGSLSFTKKSGNANITIAENGKVTVKKGLGPSVYTVFVSVTADGDDFYKSKTVTESFSVKVKRENTLTVRAKTATVTAGKKTTLDSSDVLVVKRARGDVTYTKKSGNKKIVVKKSGKVIVKRGLKPNTYKVKVAVKAAGNSIYGPKTVTKTFKIRVKAATSSKQLTTAQVRS